MAKRITFVLLTLLLTVATIAEVRGQYVYTASSRLVRVQEALNPKAGHLTFYNHLDFNTVSDVWKDPSSSSDFVSQWIVQNSIHIDYSITDYLLVSLNPTVYRDVHRKQEEANSPLDNLMISAKLGSYGLANDFFYAGLLASVLIPTADYNNNNYGVPYSAGSSELGINLLLSYYTDNLFPEEALNINLNLGYYNYFDKDKDISHTKTPFKVKQTTSAFNYALGIKYPTSTIDLMLEFWGQAFINQPPSIAYTRENMSFITAGLRLKPVAFASLTLAGDIMLGGKKDETTYSNKYGISSYPSGSSKKSYPEWRFVIGFELNILPLSVFSTGPNPRAVELTPENQTSDVIKQLEGLSQEKEDTAQKVDELKRRRQEIEKNLQQLRQILKETGTPSSEEEGKEK
jgi:hypothetical protein